MSQTKPSAWPVFDDYEARGGDRELVANVRQAIEDELDRQHIASDCPESWLHRKWGTLCGGFAPDFDRVAIAAADASL